MNTTLLEETQIVSVREEWTEALRTLEKNITEWSAGERWQIRHFERIFTEASTGQYTAPDLVIETPDGERLTVEVKGRGLAEGSGRVQLSAWPTLFRVILLHKSGEENWVIRTDSGIPIRQPWNRETFISLAKDLLNADK